MCERDSSERETEEFGTQHSAYEHPRAGAVTKCSVVLQYSSFCTAVLCAMGARIRKSNAPPVPLVLDAGKLL